MCNNSGAFFIKKLNSGKAVIKEGKSEDLPEDDSWISILTKAGYDVQPILVGLGSNDAFVNLFVEHIKDAAAENHITLQ